MSLQYLHLTEYWYTEAILQIFGRYIYIYVYIYIYIEIMRIKQET